MDLKAAMISMFKELKEITLRELKKALETVSQHKRFKENI